MMLDCTRGMSIGYVGMSHKQTDLMVGGGVVAAACPVTNDAHWRDLSIHLHDLLWCMAGQDFNKKYF